MQKSFTTSSVDETIDLARQIGRQLKGGEVFELSSDLGGGKTTFTRGLVEGFGSAEPVSSPTFTISQVYQNAQHKLFIILISTV